MKTNRFTQAVGLIVASACICAPAQNARALDPNPVILTLTQAQPLADGRFQVSLQWNALAGATYQVQGQEDLSGEWLSFGLVKPTTATGSWTGTIAAGLVDEGRFFMRLVLPQERVSSLEPAFVSLGGGVFYILGQCFAPSDRVFVNGAEATTVVFEDHTRLKVTIPAMSAGVYDVEVRGSDGVTVHAKLTDGLTVNPTGRSDEAPPKQPETVVLDTPAGKVRVHLPDDIKAGDTITGTVVVEPNGETKHKKRDLVLPGRGLWFLWKRTYRSKNGPSTAQGEGWDYSYNISAVQSGADVVVHDGEARADTFFNQGDGTWSRPEFFRQGTMSGTVFTLTFADKTAWLFRAFDAPLAAGKIDRITDRNGNQINFAYDGAGRLVTIIDTLSRNYTVAYNGAGRIASVTDFTGRAVTYGYNAAGDLITVTSPPVTGTPTGNDFPAGKTVTYGYSSGFADARLNHNLLTVTSPLGHVVLTNTYAPTLVPTDFEFDRCITCVSHPGPPYPMEQVSLNYSALTPNAANRFATTLTIINNHGNVSEVRSDSRNRPLEVREYTGRSTIGAIVTDVANRPTGQLRAGDPVFFATAMEWNPNSCLTRLTQPRGGIIESIFQSDLSPTVNPREAGNMRVLVTTAAPAVPSDFAALSERWDYLSGFGSVEPRSQVIGCSIDVLADSPQPAPVDKAQYEQMLEYAQRLIDSLKGPSPFPPPIVLPPPWPKPDPKEEEREKERFKKMQEYAQRVIDDLTDSMDRQAEAEKRREQEAADKARREKEKADQIQRQKEQLERMRRFKEGGQSPKPPPPGGSKSSHQSDASGGFPITHTDARGSVTTCAYDASGNVLSITPQVAGTAHTFAYNGFGQPTARIWPANANGSARRDELNYYSAGPQTGWLQSVKVDANNLALTTTYEYNAVGILTRFTDPRGKDTIITTNALDQPVRIASREASAGVRYETDIRYDANNNVTSIDVQNKDETGALVVANPYFTTQYQYDALNRPVRVIQEVDAATTITTERVIDADNHRVTIRSPEAFAGTQPLNTVRVTFDERGLPFQTTLAPGAAGQSTTQYDYDLDGNVAVASYGMELVPKIWLLTWDGLPTPIAPKKNKIDSFPIEQGITESATGAMRDYEQEPTSVEVPNLVITLAESHASPFRITGNFDGDASNTKCRLRSITDPMGNTTTNTYDTNGNITKMRSDGEHTDAPGSGGNVRLAESRWTFDLLNRPTVWTGLLLDNAGAQTGSITASTSYAPNSQPSSTTDPRGNITTLGYDTANRPVLITDAKTNTRAFAYDANGNLLTVTATDKSDLGSPQQVFVVTRTFDGLDRRFTSADNVGNTIQHAYDSRSNLVLHTDALNIQTRYVYDGLSRPLSTARDMDNDGASATDPQDIVGSQTWDRNSRLATATNANGFVTTRSYDALNRTTSTHEADGTTSSVLYDVHHNIVQSQDANGTVIVNTFDALNRPTGRNIAPGAGVANTTTNTTTSYDGLSRVKSAITNGSATTTIARTYDSLSRMTIETQGALTVTRAYDAAGNVTALTYPGGNVVTTTYDSLNRPFAVTDSVNGAIITHSYIGPDRVERQTHGNGTITTYQYDGVQGVPNAPGDLGWRKARAKFVTGPGGTPTHDSRQYFHNANQQLVQRINVPIGLAHIYTLDNADRLVNTIVQQGGPPLRNTNYVLDKAGNRLNVGGPGTPNPGPYQMNPTLPDPGDAQMNQYTLAPTGQFTYDANGNRQNHNTGPANLQHVYDYANRLVAINNLTTAQPVATYMYDALGRRVRKTTFPGGAITDFLFSGGIIIEERDGGGAVLASITYSGGDGSERLPEEQLSFNFAPAVVNHGGATQTHHADPAGSVMLITNAAGSPAERYDYQDFGDPQFFSAAYVPLAGSLLGNPILFHGHRYDTESGYIHIPRCSYFDPKTGSWIIR